MGKIKHMLGSRTIVPYSGYQHFVMEAAENIHIHWRDTRLQLFPEDFDNLHKYVRDAHKKWEELGRPIQDNQNINLGDPFPCKSPGFFSNKMTIEEQEAGGIHLHWRDTRIHADHGHFIEFATMTQEAHLAFKELYKTKVKIDDLDHPATADKYMKWLDEYTSNMYENVDPDDCVKICMEKNKCLAYNAPISDELDRKVLFAIYESMLKYGYASGPYHGDYVVCWLREDGSKYMAAAHRWAALKKLGYDEIDVCLIRMPDPTQVKEQ